MESDSESESKKCLKLPVINMKSRAITSTHKQVFQSSSARESADSDEVHFVALRKNHKAVPGQNRNSSTRKKKTGGALSIKYKYAIMPGNNSRAVLAAFRSRPWWEKAPVVEKEGNTSSTKPASRSRSAPTSSGKGSKRAEPVDWDLLWEMYRNPNRIASVPTNSRRALNHFDDNACLVTKKGLYQSLKMFCLETGTPLEQLVPLTFYLKREEEGRVEADRADFLQYCGLNSSSESTDQLFWIVKPASMSNRGFGIQMATSAEEVLTIVDRPPPAEREVGSAPDRRRFGWIVQKYMMAPLLVGGRKFDIRCWVLLLARPESERRDELEAYFFRDGYIRTSCVKYDPSPKSIKNRFMHLTNDAVQNQCPQYGKYEAGNKLSFEEFQAYLDENFPGKHAYVDEVLLPKLKELAALSIRAVSNTINKSRRRYCFELFGYDFMMDANFNVFIIEVNSNPCLEFACPMLEQYITNLLANVVDIAIDTIFPPPKGFRQTKDRSENRLDFIFSTAGASDINT